MQSLGKPIESTQSNHCELSENVEINNIENFNGCDDKVETLLEKFREEIRMRMPNASMDIYSICEGLFTLIRELGTSCQVIIVPHFLKGRISLKPIAKSGFHQLGAFEFKNDNFCFLLGINKNMTDELIKRVDEIIQNDHLHIILMTPPKKQIYLRIKFSEECNYPFDEKMIEIFKELVQLKLNFI